MAQDKQTMYAPKHPPGSEFKGGGLRGGPKRWTGNGPRPARHIPWPEVGTAFDYAWAFESHYL